MRGACLAQPTQRVRVTVTFLRMDHPPVAADRRLPPDCVVQRVQQPTVPFYRYLYNTVGAAHLWWLRRLAPDAELASVLDQPGHSLHVLYWDGAPAGFYELDRARAPDVNIGYFGLLPHAVGRRLGTAFLGHAVATAWQGGTRGVTVNTCTADNPRALPGYLRIGFRPLREMREHWDIPLHLGLVVPPEVLT